MGEMIGMGRSRGRVVGTDGDLRSISSKDLSSEAPITSDTTDHEDPP